MINKKKDLDIRIKRIKCNCGQYNNEPSKAKEPLACCSKCGKLIDERARFHRQIKFKQNEQITEYIKYGTPKKRGE